ncbi:hypothetical protein ISR92_03840 [Patescibacteria group bacterium]|nr:hypothetical protein [Patescibacteria group bacterium]
MGFDKPNFEKPKSSTKEKIVVIKKVFKERIPLPNIEKFRTVVGKYECEHPVLLEDSRNILSETDVVPVSWSIAHENLSMTVVEYLSIFHLSYEDYQNMKFDRRYKDMSNQEIVFKLHSDAVIERDATAERLYAEYNIVSPDKRNNSIESREHDSKVFVKGIKELGIAGVGALASRPREDYLDQIDEFIVIDPGKLNGGEAVPVSDRIRIGVQRTVNPDSFKKKQITDNPVITIPDRLEFGEIPRFYLKEDNEDYGRDNDTGDPINLSKMIAMTDRTRPLERTMGKAKYKNWMKNVFTVGVEELTEYLDNPKVEISDRKRKSILEARDAMRTILGKLEIKE